MFNPEEILKKLTLEEKASLCDGKDYWHLKGIERLGIPEIMVCDGPHGLRKKDYSKKGISLNTSVPAICYPPAVTTACSWDPDLLYEMGEALGKKCQKENVGILLGPGVNIKRSPLCGRNFEYFSEDPILAGELATGFINGVQSQGVGTSLKHFAVNSQETRRMTVSSEVDERALREIYLTAFEIAVKKAKPWTVMNAYNKINGIHASENNHTQTEILRDLWKYDGAIISDWGAVNNRVKGLCTGNDIEMPSSYGYGAAQIINGVKSGEISEETLNQRALTILKLINKCLDGKKDNYIYSDSAFHSLARKIASESIVLLKNDGILPLKKNCKIALIGDMAKNPRYQGAGSSKINPIKIENAFDELSKQGFNITYAKGYERKGNNSKKNEQLRQEAMSISEQCDITIAFIGLTEEYESEGYDRSNMDLPSSHNELIEALCSKTHNLIVVLSGGSPVALPWFDKVNAVLNSYLGGQAGGGAVADILSGKVNPSGKLAETWPLCYSDTPAENYFPGSPKETKYKESIYIGYRYYEKQDMSVRFPFGFGLSYTSFKYSDLKLSAEKFSSGKELKLSFKVTNIGAIPGAETVQIYVGKKESCVFRPIKELKAFKKVKLNNGETKTVNITLGKRSFSFFDTFSNDWAIENGDYEIFIGASSQDIRLTDTVTVTDSKFEPNKEYHNNLPSYFSGNIKNVSDEEFNLLLNNSPVDIKKQKLDITDNFENAKETKNGKKIYNALSLIPNPMAVAIATQTPFRNFVSMSAGVFDNTMADGLLKILNNEKGGAKLIIKRLPKAIKGIGKLIKEI